jgi:diphthamide synthase (EF-2-diphthine--ammonia ligase)
VDLVRPLWQRPRRELLRLMKGFTFLISCVSLQKVRGVMVTCVCVDV